MSSKKVIGCLLLSLMVSSPAFAQSSGWTGKVGYNEFYPQVSSGQITGIPGSSIDVGKGGGLFVSAAYSFDEHVGAELAFGVPPRLDIIGEGTVSSAGKIGDAKIYAPILMGQYHFAPGSAFRPYVGVGVTYVKFASVRTSPILGQLLNPGGALGASIDNAWGVAAQVGASYAISPAWSVDGSIVPMRVKTTARLTTGQSVDVKVNPIAVNLSLAYHF